MTPNNTVEIKLDENYLTQKLGPKRRRHYELPCSQLSLCEEAPGELELVCNHEYWLGLRLTTQRQLDALLSLISECNCYGE
jgi:hypothetical protein